MAYKPTFKGGLVKKAARIFKLLCHWVLIADSLFLVCDVNVRVVKQGQCINMREGRLLHLDRDHSFMMSVIYAVRSVCVCVPFTFAYSFDFYPESSTK